MTTRASTPLLLLAAVLAGCASGGADSAGKFGGSGGQTASGSGGSASQGGQSGASKDAGVVFNLDAGRGQVPISLATDAPVFNWDTRTCTGCNDSGGAGGAAGGGGSGSGSGGSTGTKTGSGGSAAAGGSSSSGGMPGSGGRVGVGGSTLAGGRGGSMADAAPDVGRMVDGSAPSDGMPAGGAGGLQDAGIPKADAVVPTDVRPTDVLTSCNVQIRAIVPATGNLEQFPLVAGDKMQVVLRAEILSGGPADAVWDWQATRDGVAVSGVVYGQEDSAAVAIPVALAGSYAFKATARASLCSASARAYAVASTACPTCDRSVILRAAPPPTVKIPVQSGAIALAGSQPFSQNDVVLAKGVPVLVSPSVGSSKVDSYVRINNPAGDLIADGLAQSQVGFGSQLLATDNNLTVLRYDVLVVPIDGLNGTSVAATAPQLFQNLTPELINVSGFALSGGVTVTGNATAADGAAVADARVILTNRNPSDPALSTDLIFSSVGRANAQGSYELHAQRGAYWVSVSPPSGSGLAEALAPEPVTLSSETTTTISFQWKAPAMAPLNLRVFDASGTVPLDGARVRITSAQATKVGTVSVTAGGATTAQEANGNVRLDGTTSMGTVTFASLPTDASYDVLIVPATLGANATTTSLALTVPPGGATYDVLASAQRWISGKLEWGATNVAADWSRVHLVAYDRSVDTPEPPQTVGVSPDGSYAIGVSPGRPYVVLVVPDVGSGLARTFVGPGALQASEFPLSQKVLAAMPWSATVMDEYQNGIAGTALQVFCGPSWPNCIDPTVPLAETTSEDRGNFTLALPDPSSR